MTRPLVSRPLAVWIFCTTAIQPFTGSKLASGVTAVLLVLAVLANRRLLASTRVSLALLAYLAWLAMSVFWSVLPGVTASAVLVQLLLVVSGLLVAVGRGRAELLRLFADTSAAFVLLNIALGVFVPSVGRGSQGHYTNIIEGLFADKNLFAFFAVLALGAALCALVEARSSGATSPLDIARPVVAVVGVVLADSATGLSLSLVTVVLVMLLRLIARSKGPVAVPVTGVLVVLGSLTWVVHTQWSAVLGLLGRDATLTGRTRIWYAVTRAIAERPMQGYGWKALWVDGDPTTTRIWSDNYGVPFFHAHDGYLDVTAQLGLVGLALTVLFLGTVLVRGWRSTVDHGSGADMWPVVLVTVMALYNITEATGFTTVNWVLLVALSSALASRRKDRECSSPTPGASSFVSSP
ncbi:O-antigen ligase [Phycicoccus sp. Root563]|uniref:O-antigen ligase family protein n=1 Tax=Phycicoccus sp. Root563 TaxID=1736562 RepID=UPI0009E793D8|nr:O-antigen ligase family protein [Phycicoccus sp. Root563]